MRLQPKGTSRCGWIDTDLAPPGGFIATAMHFAVVTPAQWNGELITDLPSECRRLCKAQMMRIGGAPAAD